MDTKTQTAAELLPKTLAILAPAKQKPTMPLSWPDKRQREWLDRWVRLSTEKAKGKQLESLRQAEFDIHSFCRDYSKSPGAGRRMVIWGPNGTGKTHMARAIHRWAIQVAMRLPLTSVRNSDGGDYQLATSQFLFWPGIVDGFKRDQWSIIDEAVEQSLLVIDDIGAEHDPSGIGKEKLYYILERRAQRWMVLTTNCPPADWETKFEKRIASRFLRNCTVIDLCALPDFNAR